METTYNDVRCSFRENFRLGKDSYADTRGLKAVESSQSKNNVVVLISSSSITKVSYRDEIVDDRGRCFLVVNHRLRRSGIFEIQAKLKSVGSR